MDAFVKYYEPHTKTHINSSQEENENFEHFVTDLKLLAKICNFGNQEEWLICDRIVTGVRDYTLSERLLQILDLTLMTAEVQCRAAKESKFQM